MIAGQEVMLERALVRLVAGGRLLEPGFRTAIGDALASSVELAESVVGRSPDGPPRSKAPAASGLLSDGAQTSGVPSHDEGAARAKQAGIPAFTIALVTPNGALDPRAFGGGFGSGRRIPVPRGPSSCSGLPVSRASGCRGCPDRAYCPSSPRIVGVAKARLRTMSASRCALSCSAWWRSDFATVSPSSTSRQCQAEPLFSTCM